MRNGSDVTNHRDLHSRRLKCAECRLPASARTLHVDAQRSDAMLLRLFRAFFCCNLRGKRSRLLRSLKALLTTTRPRNRVSANVRNRNYSVVEGRLNMSNTRLDILLDLFLRFFGCHLDLSHHFFGASFLPAIVLAGPFRVRAFVWVRCPRTGSPRRWRSPR
jgi:hypothetical protein